jgi:hypothetical protein
MLVAAALVPDTALLVPGAAGRADVLVELRAGALDAVATLLAADPGLVALVAPGPRDRELVGPVRASLAAAGIPDRRLAWSRPAQDGATTASVAASVGLLLLARSGWGGPVRVLEVGPHDAGGSTVSVPLAARLRAAGVRLVADRTGSDADDGPRPTAVGLLVVGSLSARHGPDAALADDDRAPAYDAVVLADLADAGSAPRARLAALDAGLARELAVTGWGPWQVLLGAVGDRRVDATVLAADTPFGARHLAVTWVPRPGPSADRS